MTQPYILSRSSLVALFPGMAALVSLYGLVFDPSEVERQIGALSGILHAETLQLLSQQLHRLVETSGEHSAPPPSWVSFFRVHHNADRR